MIAFIKQSLVIALSFVSISSFCPDCFAVEQKTRLNEEAMLLEKERLIAALVDAEKEGEEAKIVDALEALFNFYTVYDFHEEAERIGRIAIDKRQKSDLPKAQLALMYMRHSISLTYMGRLVEAQQALSEGMELSQFTGAKLQSNLLSNKAYVYRLLGEYDASKQFFLSAYNVIKGVENPPELLTQCTHANDSLPVETAKVLLQLGAVSAEVPESTLDIIAVQKCAADILEQSDDYYAIVAKAELSKTLQRSGDRDSALSLATQVLADGDTRHPQQLDMLTLLLKDEVNNANTEQKRSASYLLQHNRGENATNKIAAYVLQIESILGHSEGFYALTIQNDTNYPHPIKTMSIYNILIELHLDIGEDDVATWLFQQAQALSNNYILKSTNPIAWKSARADLVDTYLARFFDNDESDVSRHAELIELIANVYDHPPRFDLKLYKNQQIDETGLRTLYYEWIAQEKELLEQTHTNAQDHQLLTIRRDAFFTQWNHAKQQLPKQESRLNVDVPSDTAVYRYVSTENQSFVLVMTERSTHIFQLPSYDIIAETVARFNQAVSDLMQIPDDLQDAIETILPLDPIKNTAIQNIVIIADGALHHLPFASLKADLGEGRLEFLISRYAILHSYSIADYLDNREIPAVETDLSIAAFADPALGDALGQFPRLTNTRDEVDAIKNAFPNADYSIAMDHHANSQFLMSKQTRQSTILHISTHGYYNPAFPDIVGLVTSPSDGSDPTGFLSLSELLGFPVSSKLVVIAGCETTLGKSYKSAGVNSMSRGFVSQGAESVLATLWPIQDKASSLFMVQFYQNLAQSNGDASKALQQTQVQFSQRGRYKQPKYWSGFVLYATNKSSAQIQTSI